MIQDALVVATIRNCCPETRAIYLFGSVSRGGARQDSDMDLAVAGAINRGMLTDCRFALETALNVDVDLVHLDSVSTILQKEIVSEGHLLWAASPVETENFALFVISSYQKLIRERASIIESGQASGRYYQP